MKREALNHKIQKLSDQLVKNWPLYSFVTSNPLSGLEDLPFDQAIKDMRKYLNINGYPSADAFRQAFARGHIDPDILKQELKRNDIDLKIEASMERMQDLEPGEDIRPELTGTDRNLIKWLSVFLDQGSLEWPMPYRDEGFYTAWKKNARLDLTLPKRKQVDRLPDDPMDTLIQALDAVPKDELENVLKHHLLALPGWTGFIKYRMDQGGEWQQAYPISMIEYLAVRLSIGLHFGKGPADLVPVNEKADCAEEDILKTAWLRAMERSYRNELNKKLAAQPTSNATDSSRPAAQMVFCIDTRSERIRRAIEQVGDYETFGYAGFFGVAMDYHHPEKNIHTKSCPPILKSQFVAHEHSRPQNEDTADRFHFYQTLQDAFNDFRFTLKNNIPASFGYVESSGFFYGIVMLFRTLFPTRAHRLMDTLRKRKGRMEWFSKAELFQRSTPEKKQTQALSVSHKTDIAKAAFDLMGWDTFAPVVVFAGHGSQTANNPFGSSLDCGACAGNKGRHNARALADICNDREVRKALADHHGIHIPDDTLFVAAEHNTTSNHIEFYDHHIPKMYRRSLVELKENMDRAQHLANLEQFSLPKADVKQSLHEGHRRTIDWAESRPEWGLAGNASFIIGSRKLSSNLNLNARSFLHSYEWDKDPEGTKLEAILLGPMVVTQWINNHYYFASVDNDTFGSGSKTTHNVTGKFGVVQGNGGDLRSGLPLESLREDDQQLQHFPLRLSVFIHAPESRVRSIIDRHPDTLAKLIDNEWVHLSIIDPEHSNTIIEMDAYNNSLSRMAG